jgi:hypothetical protein
MVTEKLKPAALNATHFRIDNFHHVSEKMKTKYDATMKVYPNYIIQTGFNFVQPYGRKPRIANDTVIAEDNDDKIIKKEPSSQQYNIIAVQLSTPMEVEIDSGNDSDCMIVEN